jgi:ATPase family associated with various cellular activities (AAA)
MSNHDEDDRIPFQVSDLTRLLEKRAPRAAAALAASQAAWPVIRWARSKIRDHHRYSVKVPGNPGDALFEELHRRILEQIPQEKRRALLASASDARRLLLDADGNIVPRNPSAVRLRYDGSSSQTLTLGGHKVKVGVSEGQSATGGLHSQSYKPPEIIYTAQSPQGRDAVVAEIEDANAAIRSRSRRPSFWMFNQWDEWERVEEMPDRAMNSVILPEGQLERIITDIGSFIEAEAQYMRRCMPWHRGHLYWGPPGTGKTSVARAVATRFGLDVWYLPLSDIKRDASLLKSIHRIGAKSVVILEDIDVFHAATRRDDQSGGMTLSGLLNALDGLGTPHGLIYIMTSNTPGMLDEAILRTGRVDLAEEFSLAEEDEIRRFLEWWYGESLPGGISWGGLRIPHSDVAEFCKCSATIQEAARRLSLRASSGSAAAISDGMRAIR